MHEENLKARELFKQNEGGEHICYIYKNKKEHAKILSSYIQHGLKSGKKCIIGGKRQQKTKIIDTLQEKLDVSHFREKEQLIFSPPEKLYLTNGGFNPEHLISKLRTLEKQAKKQGFNGLQGTVEMPKTLASKLEIDKIFEYEAKLNHYVEDADTFLLCQYDENKCSPQFLLDVIYSHPKILLYGTLYENPYYLPPDQFLARKEGTVTPELYKSVTQDIQHRSKLVEKETIARNRMKQLSSLLSLLQKINRITARETELATMFQKSAAALVELGDYKDVSILLCEEQKSYRLIAHASSKRAGKDDYKQKKEFPCVKDVIENEKRELVEIGEKECARCRMCKHCSTHRTLVLPMLHNEKFTGVIHLCIEPNRKINEQEKKLLNDVADELAFARENISEKIEKKEEKFRKLAEHANHFIYIREKNGNFSFLNQRAVDILGYSREELLGEKPWKFIHPQQRTSPTYQKKIQKLQRGEPVEGVIQVITKSGKQRYLKSKTVPIKENGEVKRIIGIARDVTKQLKREKKLQLYKRAVEGSNDLMYALDKEYRYIFANKAYLTYHNISAEDIIGTSFKKFNGKHTFKELKPYFERVLQGETVELEDSYTYPELGLRHFLFSYYPLRDNGTVKGIVVTGKDITERKTIQEKIEAIHYWAQKLNTASNKEELFQYSLKALEETLDFDKAMLYLKEGSFLRMEEYRGYDMIPEKHLQLSLDAPRTTVKAANTQKSLLVNNEYDSSREYATYQSVNAELAVPIIRNNDVLGVLTVGSKQVNNFEGQDQRLLELLASHIAVALNELEEKQKRISLQQLETLRSEFLEMAAHEINTPLTPIKTKLEMLEKGYFDELNQKQKETVKSTLESLDRLTKLVSDFRRVNRIRSKTKQLTKQQCSLADAIEKAVNKYKNMFEKEDMLLIKNIQNPLKCKCDENRIMQVIQNLVENALDYADDKIWIKAWEEEKTILVSVRDNGPGIPLEHQEQIFEPFYRVERERTRTDRKFGGSGLGLYICKQIVEAHNGQIWLDSKLGEGATFTIALPKE